MIDLSEKTSLDEELKGVVVVVDAGPGVMRRNYNELTSLQQSLLKKYHLVNSDSKRMLIIKELKQRVILGLKREGYGEELSINNVYIEMLEEKSF